MHFASPQVEIIVRFFIGVYRSNGTYTDDVRVIAWCGPTEGQRALGSLALGAGEGVACRLFWDDNPPREPADLGLDLELRN